MKKNPDICVPHREQSSSHSAFPAVSYLTLRPSTILIWSMPGYTVEPGYTWTRCVSTNTLDMVDSRHAYHVMNGHNVHEHNALSLSYNVVWFCECCLITRSCSVHYLLAVLFLYKSIHVLYNKSTCLLRRELL